MGEGEGEEREGGREGRGRREGIEKEREREKKNLSIFSKKKLFTFQETTHQKPFSPGTDFKQYPNVFFS